jgi:hypothetical protein
MHNLDIFNHEHPIMSNALRLPRPLYAVILGLLGWLVLASPLAQAQEPTVTPLDQHVESMRFGMKLLGGWALANIVTGSLARSQTSGTTRYFHEMNAGWNAVNLTIASAALLTLPDVSSWTLEQGYQEASRLDKILLFNAGLDLGYMALGYGLIERGKRLDSSRLRGYGQSLLLQGAFLFVFDLAFAYFHVDITEAIRVQTMAGGAGLTFSMNL